MRSGNGLVNTIWIVGTGIAETWIMSMGSGSAKKIWIVDTELLNKIGTGECECGSTCYGQCIANHVYAMLIPPAQA